MRKIVVASTRRASGKTSLIVGLAKTMKVRVGYIKPLGDRLLYRKKRLWDYDAALMTDLLQLDESPEDISIGHDHSKLRYMYDEAGIKDRLVGMAERVGEGRDVLFAEGCRGLTHGASVHLDPLSVAEVLGAELVLVASGPADTVVDDLQFIARNVDLSRVDLRGVIVNKVLDPWEFDEVHTGAISGTGIPVLGVVPAMKELERFSVRFLSDALFAKALTGETGMERQVERIFVGAMSGQAALRSPQFNQVSKCIITSGDRADMVSAALDSDTAAVILTNNVPTTPKLVAKAEDRGIPLLLVAHDTYQTAKLVDGLEPLLHTGDVTQIDALEEMVRNHLDLGALTDG